MEGETHSSRREITRGTIALYKQYMGRGPTTAHTHINEDVVTVILGESLLPAETSLVAGGHSETVRQIRRDFQSTMSESLQAMVEKALGRRVICILSDHSPDPDYATEVFLLEPQRSEDAVSVPR